MEKKNISERLEHILHKTREKKELELGLFTNSFRFKVEIYINQGCLSCFRNYGSSHGVFSLLKNANVYQDVKSFNKQHGELVMSFVMSWNRRGGGELTKVFQNEYFLATMVVMWSKLISCSSKLNIKWRLNIRLNYHLQVLLNKLINFPCSLFSRLFMIINQIKLIRSHQNTWKSQRK